MSANPWDTVHPAVPWINGGAWGGLPVHRMRELAVSIKSNTDRLTNATVDLPAAGVYPSKAGFRKFYGDVLDALRELCNRTTPNRVSINSHFVDFEYVTAENGTDKINEAYLGIDGASASDWQFVSDIRPWVKMRTAIDRLCYVKAAHDMPTNPYYVITKKVRPQTLPITGGQRATFNDEAAAYAYKAERTEWAKGLYSLLNVESGEGEELTNDERYMNLDITAARVLTYYISAPVKVNDTTWYVDDSWEGYTRTNRFVSIGLVPPFDVRTQIQITFGRVPDSTDHIGPASLACTKGTLEYDAVFTQDGDDDMVIVTDPPIRDLTAADPRDMGMPGAEFGWSYKNEFGVDGVTVWQTLPSLYVTP